MSTRITAPAVRDAKGQRKLTMLTAYDYPMAQFVDQAGIDMILVGDSLAMVVLGHQDTLAVGMDEMLHHTRAVSRGAARALVIGDMPFMSYQVSDAQAVTNAGRFLKEAQAQAVKLEGGARVLSRVRAIIDAGIPVQGHLGLTPQSAAQLGGFKVQGKSAAARAAPDRRCAEPGRGRLLQYRAGSDSGPDRRTHHGRRTGADHRHRRGSPLRRPGPGDS